MLSISHPFAGLCLCHSIVWIEDTWSS